METATNGDVRLRYATEGTGETVAFVGDLGFGAWLWSWQHGAVAGPFEALTWTHRRTGESDAPPGPYDVATLADDLEVVLADAGARRAHLVGCGLGGMVALEYALAHDRARSLTLLGTAADGGVVSLPDRLVTSSDDSNGLRSSLSTVLSAKFLDAQPDAADRIAEWRAAEDADPDGWRALAAAARGFDRSDRLYEITVPALAIHGETDAIVPAAAGERLADGLPRGEFLSYPDAGHLVGIERSAAVNDRLLGFLEEHAEPSWD